MATGAEGGSPEEEEEPENTDRQHKIGADRQQISDGGL